MNAKKDGFVTRLELVGLETDRAIVALCDAVSNLPELGDARSQNRQTLADLLHTLRRSRSPI